MVEVLLFLGVICFGLYKVAKWLFNALVGVLPATTADAIRRWTKFGIAAFVALAVLTAMLQG